MVNVPDEEPAGITIESTVGLATPLLLLVSPTVVSAAAGPFSVTAPWADCPPARALGLTVTDAGDAGPTVIVAVLAPVESGDAAVTVTVAGAPTCCVVTANVVEVLPAGIDMLAGTLAAVELELNVIGYPPAGAALLIEIVPLAVAPPSTCDGARFRLPSMGAHTRHVAVTVPPGADTLIGTDVVAVTAFVSIVNVAEDAPAATVMVPTAG